MWIGGATVLVAGAVAAVVLWPDASTTTTTETTSTSILTTTTTPATTTTTTTIPATTIATAAPVLAPISDQTAVPGDSVDLAISATDADGDPLVLTATGLPEGLAIGSDGRVAGTVTANPGSYTVAVTANDGTTSVTQVFTWTVSEPAPASNAAPEFVQTADWIDSFGNVIPTDLTDLDGYAITEGAPLTIAFFAMDSDGDAVAITATGLPGGLAMDAAGRLGGAAAPGTARRAPYDVVVTASDGTASVNVAMRWKVAFGSGATCEAIAAEYSYANAVAYWLREDSPAGLDVDGNGLPCVGVFTTTLGRLDEVDAFYGATVGMSSGLACADFAALTYETLAAYWLIMERPAGLDEGFGLPCDITYGDAAAGFFGFDYAQ